MRTPKQQRGEPNIEYLDRVWRYYKDTFPFEPITVRHPIVVHYTRNQITDKDRCMGMKPSDWEEWGDCSTDMYFTYNGKRYPFKGKLSINMNVIGGKIDG